MDVLMMCHNFTSAWQSEQSLRWSLSLLDVAYMLACLKSSSICENCMFILPFKNTYSHVFSFVHLQTHLFMIFHLQARPFACIIYSSIGEHGLLDVLPLFIPSVVTPCLFVYLYPQSLMTRRHQIHKPPCLPWCMIISNAGDRERRKVTNVWGKIWAGMEASVTAGENCTKIIGRWWWEIRIDIDFPQGLAWLPKKSAQFLEGAVWAARRLGRQNLCNFWKE